MSVLPNKTKKQRNNNENVEQMAGVGETSGGGNNYHFTKVEYETLSECYGKHREDRWMNLLEMSRIKIEN